MSDRYQELFRTKKNLCVKGSPVIIDVGVIQKDLKLDKVLAQIKVRNISTKTIISCKVGIRAFEPNGNELLAVPEYSFLDLNAKCGEDFGSKEPIYLPQNTSRSISVYVKEIVFDDGTVWKSDSENWTVLPEQERIIDRFSDEEIVKQYNIEAGDDGVFVPGEEEGFYRCTCGAINLPGNGSCYKCNRSFEKINRLLDIDYLTAEKDKRIINELELERIEEEKREKKRIEAKEKRKALEKKRKKIKRLIIIFAPIVCILTIAIVLCCTVFKPYIENSISYYKADKLLEAGQYDEAKSAFEGLGEFKNSKDKALESQYKKAESYESEQKYDEAIKIWTSLNGYSDSNDCIERAKSEQLELNYQKALSLKDSGDYSGAASAFEALGDYKDSENKVNECNELIKESDYQAAINASANGDYENALKVFKELGDYKDSLELYKKTCFEYADELFNSSEYKKAIDYYSLAGDTTGAVEKRIESEYKYACQCLDSKNYGDAITYFGRATGFADADSKYLDSKYGFVLSNKDNTNFTTFSYLKDLVKVDYPGAKKIYDDLYSLKIKVTAINNSEYSKSNMSSISRYDTVYFHYKLVGGKPGVNETIKVVTCLPNCSPYTAKTTISLGQENWSSVWYDYGGASGTATIKIYDSKGNLIGSDSVRIY